MKYKEIIRNSPNQSGSLTPKGIVLHHSAGSYSGSVSWILNPQSKVSYHCMVSETGERTVLVPDNRRAWHAGRSSHKGRANCNDFMLGISVSGDTYKRDLTQDEIESVAEWCISKMQAYNIVISDIVTHQEVAPNRKTDVSPKAKQQITDKIAELLNHVRRVK